MSENPGVNCFAFFRVLLHVNVTIFQILLPSPTPPPPPCAFMERMAKYSQTLKENGIFVINASPGWVWGKPRASLVSSEKGKARKALHEIQRVVSGQPLKKNAPSPPWTLAASSETH